MRLYCLAESVFGTFHKITSTTTVGMNFDTTGQYIHAFDIDECSTDNGQVTVGYFQYFSVSYQNGTIFQPPLWSKDAGIDELSQHRI